MPSVPLLTEVDALLRSDHFHLTDTDECYSIGEYTPRAGFSFSETNSLISNLKKTPDKRGMPEWRYKERAILQAGKDLREATNLDWLKGGVVVVPIPPSKAKDDPMYDDRILQVANVFCQGTGAHVRELLYQTTSTEACHRSDSRRDVSLLKSILKVDEALAKPTPKEILLLDDMLTTGAHFVAAKHVLGARFPSAEICGFFVARRVIVNDDYDDSNDYDIFHDR